MLDRQIPDADKADQFVFMMCKVTRNDLVRFFRKWGSNIDPATTQIIAAMMLPLPKTDPSTIFGSMKWISMKIRISVKIIADHSKLGAAALLMSW